MSGVEIIGVVKKAWCWKCSEVTEHEVSRRHKEGFGLWEIEICKKCGETIAESWSGDNIDTRIPKSFFDHW